MVANLSSLVAAEVIIKATTGDCNDNNIGSITVFVFQWNTQTTDSETKYGFLYEFISMGQCKKDVIPLLTHWSFVFFALTHRFEK